MTYSPRILVIEDNDDNLTLMRLMLERKQHTVLIAPDGLIGLEMARKEHPDLILLDLSMPEMDGWDVARALKADVVTRAIPIIAVTAHSSPRDREQALAAGCDDFVTKPFSVRQLLEKIDNLLDPY